MEKIKTNTGFKKFRKIVLRSIIALILLFLLVSIALSLPFVQTKIANYATDKLNKNYGTNINIDEVAITFFGGVKLKKVLIKIEFIVFSNKSNLLQVVKERNIVGFSLFLVSVFILLNLLLIKINNCSFNFLSKILV